LTTKIEKEKARKADRRRKRERERERENLLKTNIENISYLLPGMIFV